MYRSSAQTCVFLFGITALLFFAGVAHAESVVWSTQSNANFTVSNGGVMQEGGSCVPIFDSNGAHMSVQYSARAIDPATGASLCGATISRGQSVRFDFSPHVSQDVYWVATGFSWDSPYGDWIPDAGWPPKAEMCSEKNLYTVLNDLDREYASLSIHPPEKVAAGLSGFSCDAPEGSGSVDCIASNVGSFDPRFQFGATQGRFYFAYTGDAGNSCIIPSTEPAYNSQQTRWPRDGSGWFCDGNTPFVLQVPPQSISCPIIIESADGDSPEKPTVSTGGAACSVGTPYSITATATDPDNDNVKYGIDWDANGTVDQFAPSSGYVPSGTSQTVSRTYATEGSKSVKVLAIDDNGLTSSWSTLTFSCTDTGTEGEGEGSDIIVGGGGGKPGGGGATSPNLTIRAIPSLVRTGETTHLHWSASNVTACTVQGSNGDSFTGTISQEPEGNTSSAITQQTTYTLSCTDEDDNVLTQSTTVNVLPVWSEF